MTEVITLLTDFGSRDAYVGVMKAVILARAPAARLVDLTHEVAPQNIRQGAFALASAVPYCPPGTIHLAVVDPGVGTERAAVVVQTARARYVAPDNGLLTLALGLDPPVAAWRLTRPQFFLPAPSATFQGRDVFAPVAAHLAQGQSPADMGEPLDVARLVRFDVPPVRIAPGRAVATVLYVDRFGNVVTSLHKDDPAAASVCGVRVGSADIAVHPSYLSVARGQPLAIWGSTGHLEVSVCLGSAEAVLGLAEGDEIEVGTADRSAP